MNIGGVLVLMQFAYIEDSDMRALGTIHLFPDMAEEERPQYAGRLQGTVYPILPFDRIVYDLREDQINGMVFLIPEE